MKKLLIAILMLAACSAAIAAPDVATAVQAAKAGLAAIDAADQHTDALWLVIEQDRKEKLTTKKITDDQLAAKDAVIKTLTDDAASADTFWHRILCGIGEAFGMGIIGWGVLCLFGGTPQQAPKMFVIGGLIVAIDLALMLYARQLAWVGLVTAGVGGIFAALWWVKDHRNLHNAAIEIADGSKQLATAVPVASELKAKADAIMDQATGPLAKSIIQQATS